MYLTYDAVRASGISIFMYLLKLYITEWLSVGKKPFNYVGNILLFIYIAGLLLFGLGIYKGDSASAYIALGIWERLYLIAGGIVVAIIYVVFASTMVLNKFNQPRLTGKIVTPVNIVDFQLQK